MSVIWIVKYFSLFSLILQHEKAFCRWSGSWIEGCKLTFPSNQRVFSVCILLFLTGLVFVHGLITNQSWAQRRMFMNKLLKLFKKNKLVFFPWLFPSPSHKWKNLCRWQSVGSVRMCFRETKDKGPTFWTEWFHHYSFCVTTTSSWLKVRVEHKGKRWTNKQLPFLHHLLIKPKLFRRQFTNEENESSAKPLRSVLTTVCQN